MYENWTLDRTLPLNANESRKNGVSIDPFWGFLAEWLYLLNLCQSPKVECPHSCDVGGKRRTDRRSAETGGVWRGLHSVLAAAKARRWILFTTKHNHPHRSRVRGRLRSASIVAVGVAVRWQLALPPWPFSSLTLRGKAHPLFYLRSSVSISLSLSPSVSLFFSFNPEFSLNFSDFFIFLALVEARSSFIRLGLPST